MLLVRDMKHTGDSHIKMLPDSSSLPRLKHIAGNFVEKIVILTGRYD